MSRFPILVERLSSTQALVIACEGCGHEFSIGPEDIRNEENYCCARCGGPCGYKYVEADKCPNCEKLGFFSPVLGGCCSRPCLLQIEYARFLATRSAA